nr:unnamed protein product [Callosobruchus analis]
MYSKKNYKKRWKKGFYQGQGTPKTRVAGSHSTHSVAIRALGEGISGQRSRRADFCQHQSGWKGKWNYDR